MVSYWKRMLAIISQRKKRSKSKQQRGQSSSRKSPKQQQQHRQSGRKSSPKQQQGCDSCPVLNKHQGGSNCAPQLSSRVDCAPQLSSRVDCAPPQLKYFNANSSFIFNLSEDLLSEILKRLPVKYILRCRCVHKSWHSLIQTHSFITLHLNHQKTRSPDLLLFRNCFDNQVDNQLTLRFDHVQSQQYCRINYLPPLPKSMWMWLVHSYGLICVSDMFNGIARPKTIYLWNPLVEKYKTLPESPLYASFTFKRFTSWTALAFGFVPQVDDYMVVHIRQAPCELNPNTVVIAVYSLNTNSWKITSHDNIFISYVSNDQVVFVNGVAYWAGCNSDSTQGIIMCFDAKTNLMREIPSPIGGEYRFHRAHLFLQPFGQSISYFVDDEKLKHFDMWVLREDSKNEFLWEKKMSVDLGDHFREQVLGVRNNGEPIFFKLYKFISYNLDSHEANDFVDSWGTWDDFSSFYEEDFAPPYHISPFVESLVFLNND
ncbi:F-box domain-containing protein [Heracleum sosnowskyi]|uniref:F-box domain-containing protein n=1 Tax=Heracleum sosnowskyi TaxID=360622 RepID=A0AAD8HVT1_9APIA|nr:F-box domain-containing protein [Heracleum sosnowskyi]